MWPIVGVVGKYIAREIVFSVASHYIVKYAKKKIEEHKKSKEEKQQDDNLDP